MKARVRVLTSRRLSNVPMKPLQVTMVAPPPVPDDSGVKKPDAGKGVAVLSPVIKKKTGDVAMGAGWAQAVRQKLQGEKKAQAARRKSDKADAAKAAARPPAAPAPVGPFVPRVKLGGPGSGPQPGGGHKVDPVPAYKPYVAPKQSFLQKVGGAVKNVIGSKAQGPSHAPAIQPRIGALKIGQQHAERAKTKTPVRVSKKHPINPLKIKAPKGSSQAPGKSIGPIIKAKERVVAVVNIRRHK